MVKGDEAPQKARNYRITVKTGKPIIYTLPYLTKPTKDKVLEEIGNILINPEHEGVDVTAHFEVTIEEAGDG